MSQRDSKILVGFLEAAVNPLYVGNFGVVYVIQRCLNGLYL